jgi:hypothetical protein
MLCGMRTVFAMVDSLCVAMDEHRPNCAVTGLMVSRQWLGMRYVSLALVHIPCHPWLSEEASGDHARGGNEDGQTHIYHQLRLHQVMQLPRHPWPLGVSSTELI